MNWQLRTWEAGTPHCLMVDGQCVGQIYARDNAFVAEYGSLSKSFRYLYAAREWVEWQHGNEVAMTERDVERQILDGLRYRGFYALLTDAAQRDALRGKRALPVGWPDIIALKNEGGVTRALLIEVKRPGGKPRASQLALHQILGAHGIHVIVANSFADVEAHL